jgi:hypothetical protein
VAYIDALDNCLSDLRMEKCRKLSVYVCAALILQVFYFPGLKANQFRLSFRRSYLTKVLYGGLYSCFRHLSFGPTDGEIQKIEYVRVYCSGTGGSTLLA